MNPRAQILRARVVVPVSSPPIHDGAVVVEGNRIAAVGAHAEIAQKFSGEATDLGERTLLPGLINAHCHLDYTMMRHAIGRQKNFAEWIARINAMKRSLGDDDYLRAIADGFEELKKWGTTTALNIEAFPELLPRMPAPPIRAWWFYEMIDVRHRIDTDELLAGALTFFGERPDWLGGFGLSPHATYTASPELFQLAGEVAKKMRMPLTTHIAESPDEMRMFRDADGPLFHFLKSIGRDMGDCGKGTPLAHLARAGLLDHEWIAVHLNELDESDFALVPPGLSIAHCPRSGDFFQHRRFEMRRLRERGANICLGTDSLASNTSLNLFAEMQAVKKNEPWLRAEEILQMATENGARALKRQSELGHIAPGALADLIALPFDGNVGDVFDAILENQKPVEWMMVDGKKLTSDE
jgi:aminodeoxyfutalosine deaminase